MDSSTYLKAMNLFEVPDKFHEVARLMLTDDEIYLIAAMFKGKYSVGELNELVNEKNISSESEKLIFNCYSRAVLCKEMEEDRLLYKITDFYERLPYFAQYEAESWASLGREMIRELNYWDLEIYVSTHKDKLENSDFITIGEADAFIEGSGEFAYMVPCNCKAMIFYHDKPVNVCMNFDTGINSQFDRGHGDKIPKQRAKELIREFNKKGLMQNRENMTICNCDGICCYPVQMSRMLDLRRMYPKSNYNIQWNGSECISCGKCAKICNFGAFYFDDKNKIYYDSEKCWGCTICAPNCPKNAIELIKK